MTDEEYKRLKNDSYIKPYIDLLVPLLRMSDDDRLERNRKIMDIHKSIIKGWIKKSKNVYHILANDRGLADYLEINIEKLGEKIRPLTEMYKNEVKGKRAGRQKEIYKLLRIIFEDLKDRGLDNVDQDDFVYRLFRENDFENFGKSKWNLALADRIRKMREKAGAETKEFPEQKTIGFTGNINTEKGRVEEMKEENFHGFLIKPCQCDDHPDSKWYIEQIVDGLKLAEYQCPHFYSMEDAKEKILID